LAYFGLSAKNLEQKRALQAVANDKPFTFITGPAGCGKTLVVQAVGLDNVIETQKHRKMIYTRLQTQVGKDLGALPGDINEKTFPFIAPFMDNLEVLTSKPREVKKYFGEGDEDKQRIFFDPIQTMRGRSLMLTFLMGDEFQNVDVATMGAVATRINTGSKFVFIGNFAQIDTPSLRKPENNGLYQLLKGLYDREAYDYFDHINLREVQRDPVVEVVEDILRNHDMPAEFAELEARGNVYY